MLIKVNVLCTATYSDTIEVPDIIDDDFIYAYCKSHLPELQVNNLIYLEDNVVNPILSYEFMEESDAAE